MYKHMFQPAVLSISFLHRQELFKLLFTTPLYFLILNHQSNYIYFSKSKRQNTLQKLPECVHVLFGHPWHRASVCSDIHGQIPILLRPVSGQLVQPHECDLLVRVETTPLTRTRKASLQ